MRALSSNELQSALLHARNPDGGWGYVAGKQSRVEPTSLALIALATGRSSTEAREGGDTRAKAALLSSFETRDGLLIDPGATHPNVAFNAIAALAAQHPPLGAQDLAAKLAAALLRQRGTKLKPSKEIGQDNTLVGWAWLDGTFSWVEPTAWCLLALKKWTSPGREPRSAEAAERIDQAGRLLRDRVCDGGGWNYGNRLVLEKKLRPYASTTALGLMALQDTPDDPIVRRSTAALHRLCERERSGYALGLACLAFSRLGVPAPEVEAALARVWSETQFGGEVVATALALYVVEGRASEYEAFRV